MTGRSSRAWRHPAPWLVAIVMFASAAGIAYVLKLAGYFVMPDELTYQRNALHIARTGLPLFSGDPYYNSLSQLAALLLAPVWAAGASTPASLDASHVVNVVVFATACVPVFLLVRRITESVPASLLAGAATVAVPWFAMAGTMMTEPIAYTAFCWGVLGVHRAVSEPGPRGDVLGLLGVALATGARSQLACLAPVLVVAVGVGETVLGRADGVKAIVRRHVVLLAVVALVALLMLVTGTGLRDVIGSYDLATQGDLLPPGALAYAHELVASAALACAALPLPLALGWATGALGEVARPRVFAGALVLLLAGAALAVVAGAFSVRFTAGQNDRYISYLAPLLFVGTAAALAVGPLRLVPTALAGAFSVWLFATATLELPGPSLVSPGGAFRTVIDGRARVLGGDLGFSGAYPLDVVAVLVAIALVVVLVALRLLPRSVVAAVVGVGILGYGIVETRYTFDRVAQTQAGAGETFLASRGWADRALPDGAELNALVGAVGDQATTTGSWWDAVFYNRSVERVYQLAGTERYDQEAAGVGLDSRTGAIRGLPNGYLLVAAEPVDVGLRDVRPLAGSGDISLIRTPARPQAAFRLEAPAVGGTIPAGSEAKLRLYPTGRAHRARVRLKAVARGGPMRVAVEDRDGRRLARGEESADAPFELAFSARVPADAPADLSVGATGEAAGSLLQALAIDVSDYRSARRAGRSRPPRLGGARGRTAPAPAPLPRGSTSRPRSPGARRAPRRGARPRMASARGRRHRARRPAIPARNVYRSSPARGPRSASASTTVPAGPSSGLGARARRRASPRGDARPAAAGSQARARARPRSASSNR